MMQPSPLSGSQSPLHTRHQSLSFGPTVNINPSGTHDRRNSRGTTPSSTTFAPSFITSEEMRSGAEAVQGIEGENDFSGKRYVWVKDPQTAFVRGWVVEELGDNQILVQCDDGSVSVQHLWRVYTQY